MYVCVRVQLCIFGRAREAGGPYSSGRMCMCVCVCARVFVCVLFVVGELESLIHEEIIIISPPPRLNVSLSACYPNYSAREASWRRAFDPCAPLLFILYHYLEQNLHFGLVPEPPKVISDRSFLVAGFDTLNIARSFSCGYDIIRGLTLGDFLPDR